MFIHSLLLFPSTHIRCVMAEFVLAEAFICTVAGAGLVSTGSQVIIRGVLAIRVSTSSKLANIEEREKQTLCCVREKLIL